MRKRECFITAQLLLFGSGFAKLNLRNFSKNTQVFELKQIKRLLYVKYDLVGDLQVNFQNKGLEEKPDVVQSRIDDPRSCFRGNW